ncbi:MAG TPA: YceI family protein [Bryobacteraceae bacterium]|nr:YceI family protein [Bryobacteraceae bacterium]
MSSPQAAVTPRYDIDPAHTSAQFKVRHLMISHVKGEFTKISGSVIFDPQNLAASSIEVTIDAASISTREPQRDAHLKSAEFLDVEKFPSIVFKSAKITATGKDSYHAAGELTIHGVTRPVTLDVEGMTPEAKDPWGFLRRGATASTTIDRKDFGVAWNAALETGGVMVGDQVQITIDVEMARKA